MKTLKSVTLEGKFPELLAKYMYQQGRGTGSTLKSAFAAAGRDLFKQKGLKGRRISAFTLTVSVGTINVEETPSPVKMRRTKEADYAKRPTAKELAWADGSSTDSTFD